MDRLKKEWRETQISAEIRQKARNLAWEKIHRPVSYKRNMALSFAACAIALAVFFVRFRGVPEESMKPVSYPAPAARELSPSVPETAAVQADARPVEQAAPETAAAKDSPPPREIAADKTVSVETASDEAVSVSREAEAEPVRVVLNFVLPESGARLIWFIN